MMRSTGGLGALETQLIGKIRAKCAANLAHSPHYDTDFNVYRFLLNTERTSKHSRAAANAEPLVDTTAAALNNHLKYRQLMKLDDAMHLDDNPLFKYKLLPRGHVTSVDTANRLLWHIEYRSLRLENLVDAFNTTQCVLYQFCIYEQVLRMVMAHERATGELSGIQHIVDLTGFHFNPFTAIFLNDGAATYFSQLLHYEHYPELVNPTVMLNCARWMTIPYRMFKMVMPTDFGDRFQLHDGVNVEHLLKTITVDQLPTYLNGAATGLDTIESLNGDAIMFTFERDAGDKPAKHAADVHTLHSLHVAARKRRILPIRVTKARTTIEWMYRTDGPVWFGVYRHDNDINAEHPKKEAIVHTDAMVHPWLRVSAKFVPEYSTIVCEQPGTYYMVFCNRHSWLTKRHVHLDVTVDGHAYAIDNKTLL